MGGCRGEALLAARAGNLGQMSWAMHQSDCRSRLPNEESALKWQWDVIVINLYVLHMCALCVLRRASEQSTLVRLAIIPGLAACLDCQSPPASEEELHSASTGADEDGKASVGQVGHKRMRAQRNLTDGRRCRVELPFAD